MIKKLIAITVLLLFGTAYADPNFTAQAWLVADSNGKILEGSNFLDESFKINKEKPVYESKLLNCFYTEDLDLDNYYNDIDKLWTEIDKSQFDDFV